MIVNGYREIVISIAPGLTTNQLGPGSSCEGKYGCSMEKPSQIRSITSLVPSITLLVTSQKSLQVNTELGNFYCTFMDCVPVCFMVFSLTPITQTSANWSTVF